MLIYVSICGCLYLKGGYMDFAFHWTTQNEGKYSIQKRDTGKKGEKDFKEAGKEIERKQTNQTSGTHFFLNIDDGLWHLAKVNRILKTITYNYVYKETGKKALRRYLTKSDIETILNNITDYENKTIDIKINPPKIEQEEKKKALEMLMKHYKEYGVIRTEKIFDLVIRRGNKNKELKERQKETKAEIKELTEKIKRITENMERFEKTINADVEKIDKSIANFIFSGEELYQNTDSDLLIKRPFYKKYIAKLSAIAKMEKQQEAGKIRQKKYRERKNIMEGKPIRNKGRPKKNETD
jgi:hypothetical protein